MKFESTNSLDLTLTRDEYSDIIINVEGKKVINKAWVYFLYSVESDYYAGKTYSIDSTSVNTFGLHEEIYKEDSIWYINSLSGNTLAARKVELYDMPPKSFELNTTLWGVRQQIGETIRLVEPFYSITSGDGWRLKELDINLDTGGIKYYLDGASVLEGFYLDISELDGDELLL